MPFALRPTLIALGCFVLSAAAVAAFAAGRATPTPDRATFGAIYEQTTLPAAQERLPFTIVQPGSLPVGYRLIGVQIPKTMSPANAHVQLLYRDVARSGADVLVAERPAADATPLTQLAHGSVQQVVVAGQPASYVTGLPTQNRGNPTIRNDPAAQALVVEHGGVRVTLTGRSDFGVDRATLEAMAASLH